MQHQVSQSTEGTCLSLPQLKAPKLIGNELTVDDYIWLLLFYRLGLRGKDYDLWSSFALKWYIAPSNRPHPLSNEDCIITFEAIALMNPHRYKTTLMINAANLLTLARGKLSFKAYRTLIDLFKETSNDYLSSGIAS